MPSKPKPKRIIDSQAVEKVRRYGRCMFSGVGECWGGLDVHHITSRGAGGDDVDENMILLCRHHHNLAHNGKISKDALRRRKLWIKNLEVPLRP